MTTRIKFREPYVPIVRNALVFEDLTEEGTEAVSAPWQILSDEGEAHILTVTASEVKTDLYEGLLAHPSYFRIASFPTITAEDQRFIDDLPEYAREISQWAIWKQEDEKFFALLEHTVEENLGEVAFHYDDAFALLREREMSPARLLCHPTREAEVRRWDRLGFPTLVQSSIMAPKDLVYLLAPKEYVGYLRVVSASTTENSLTAQFRQGWVMEELIAMSIINPAGIVPIAVS